MPNKAARLRDLALAAFMLVALFLAYGRPVVKTAGEKIDLGVLVPERIGLWRSITFDTGEYRDRWQSINQLLVREYLKESFSLRPIPPARLGFVLEYSSDLRQNFSFHFPENCHRAGGNEIESLPELEVPLGEGKALKAKRIFIKGRAGSIEPNDKIVTYWLVIGSRQHFRTFYIKLDQMLSGLLSQAKTGFLVRIDSQDIPAYASDAMEKASQRTSDFIKGLYDSLPGEKRSLLFGKELG